ncbi:MAG: hypothetical protein VB022_10430 [Rikenellaceae bacterium]|nr:hypothetical protein [Rikenellaceae bacterium]
MQIAFFEHLLKIPKNAFLEHLKIKYIPQTASKSSSFSLTHHFSLNPLHFTLTNFAYFILCLASFHFSLFVSHSASFSYSLFTLNFSLASLSLCILQLFTFHSSFFTYLFSLVNFMLFSLLLKLYGAFASF